MKRFHAHISVNDLQANIEFYTGLFGQEPSKRKEDYAKWMLDDPRVNFAISSRGHRPGLNHLGFQAEDSTELKALKRLAEVASGGEVLDQPGASCCYAHSEKHWTMDPQGIAWEHFHTMSDSLEFGVDSHAEGKACCIPLAESGAAGACCVPQDGPATRGTCCG